MSSFRELPLSARLVILGYVALGAFGVLLRVPEMRTWSWEDVAATVGLALAAASEQFTVAMTHRTEVENFSVTDAVWVPRSHLGPPKRAHAQRAPGEPGGTCIPALGLVQGRLQRGPVRRRHHRGGVRLPAVRSSIVVQLHDLRGVRRRHVVTFAINEISVALIISRVEGIPLREVVVLPGV